MAGRTVSSFVVTLCVFFFAMQSTSLAIGLTKTISVRIFVDEEEPRVDALWKETLARRLDNASRVLSMYGSVRFSCTKFSVWESNNATTKFEESLKEFEKEAKPHPAELAIGFTSQYRIRLGRSNLGGTRGPMRKHILIREGAPNIQEVEKLEVLVHELSHYLGAAHSGNPSSVMRPILGDGKSRARSFRILLDEPNAAIVKLVTGEMVKQHVTNMNALSLSTKIKIRDQYVALSKESDDRVAGIYAAIMDRAIKASLAQRERAMRAREQRRKATLSKQTAKEKSGAQSDVSNAKK